MSQPDQFRYEPKPGYRPTATPASKRVRDRLDRLEDVVANSARPAPAPGVVQAVGYTIAETTYPTVAQAVYAVQLTGVAGDQYEGAVPTFPALGGVIYAANVGSAVPPVGTKILPVVVGSRWVFRYDA